VKRALVAMSLVALSACRDFSGAYDGYVERYDAWVQTQVDAGGCDAGFDVCGATCVDLQNDALHCGRCAHACLGAQCVNGACEFQTLGGQGNGVHWIALDNDFVYAAVPAYRLNTFEYSPRGKVLKVAKNGGSERALATGEAGPSIIAVDDGRVYWTTWEFDDAGVEGTLRSVSVNGSTSITPVTAADAGSAFGLAVHAGELSVLAYQPAVLITVRPDGGESRLPLSAGPATSVAVFADRRFITRPDDGVVLVVEADGGVASLVRNLTSPWGITADDRFLYITENVMNSGGRVLRVPIDGGDIFPLGENLSRPRGIAFDEEYVYVAELDGNRVLRYRKDGDGGVRVVASGQAQPNTVAVDRDFVYWGNYDPDRGGVMRVRKP
jgi:hypothetical protein